MRLPRDLSGRDLIRLLRPYGYEFNRQVGSHITVPDHDNLRLGTLNAILSDVAEYLVVDRSQVIKELLEK